MNTTPQHQWIWWGYGGYQADRQAGAHTHTQTQGGNTLMYGTVACLRPIASVHWQQQGPAGQGSHSSARSLNTRAKPANTSFRTLASTNKPIVPWISTFLEVLKTWTALQIATRKITTWIFFPKNNEIFKPSRHTYWTQMSIAVENTLKICCSVVRGVRWVNKTVVNNYCDISVLSLSFVSMLLSEKLFSDLKRSLIC